MNEGMLWFDNDKKTSLEDRITKAALYYEDKYGEKPDTCMVNSAEDIKGIKMSIKVENSNIILSGYLWIGVSDD